jgi:hypothetical protein
MASAMGAMGNVLMYIVLAISVFMNLNFIMFEKKFPTIKAMREASRKGLQLAFIHDPEGAVIAIPIKLVEGSNQLDLGKLSNAYGIKFKPRGMNEAEFMDRKLPCFHYMGQFPHSLSVRGVAALSRVRRILEARGVMTTQEKLNTLMHRDLNQPIPDVRSTMVPGSETRIPNDEMEKLARVQKELKGTKSNTVGPFVFADAHDFLHSVGMSAAVSLREWKSYIITVARGEIQPKAFMLDAKSIGMIAIMLAIAYVISKAGSMGNMMSGIKLGT